jgi:hypothetical protein
MLSVSTPYAILVEPAPQPNFGRVKFIASVAGEIVGNGDTPEAATADAVKQLYRGYARFHYGTETPLKLPEVAG